jgi:hypothetical protein
MDLFSVRVKQWRRGAPVRPGTGARHSTLLLISLKPEGAGDMAAAEDANAFVQYTPIMLGKADTPSDKKQFGVLLSEYQVTEYWDVRTTAAGSSGRRAYVVTMQQRLTLHNEKADSFGLLNSSKVYTDYPVLAVQKVAPATTSSGVSFYLEDYSPKTLNAAVSASGNQDTSSNTSRSVQLTEGSSTSVEGASSSMSIKDWASYAFLDRSRQAPSWVWGQEYPWNAINFRNSQRETAIDLPPDVQALLCDGKYVYPPSHTAQFGLDFIAHARWIFHVDGAAGSDDETAAFSHALTYWTGSHSGSGDDLNKLKLSVSMAPLALNEPIETLQLNLPCLALRPITRAGSGNGAIIGFVKSAFMIPPGASPVEFRLTSTAGNLYISKGKGFDPLAGDDAVLTAGNISANGPASFLLRFKVIDPDLELSLHLRHWKTTNVGCLMTLNVNGRIITQDVDTADADGGSDNVTTIILRSLDYANPDICDYLTVGMNEIVVTIKPAAGKPQCGYALRALAIQ